MESDKSRQATPVTFEWTGINYPQKWEAKYQELRNVDCLRHSIMRKPLTFDQHTSYFRLPDQNPAPKFSSPLIRSTSMTSYNYARR